MKRNAHLKQKSYKRTNNLTRTRNFAGKSSTTSKIESDKYFYDLKKSFQLTFPGGLFTTQPKMQSGLNFFQRKFALNASLCLASILSYLEDCLWQSAAALQCFTQYCCNHAQHLKLTNYSNYATILSHSLNLAMCLIWLCFLILNANSEMESSFYIFLCRQQLPS